MPSMIPTKHIRASKTTKAIAGGVSFSVVVLPVSNAEKVMARAQDKAHVESSTRAQKNKLCAAVRGDSIESIGLPDVLAKAR
mmetsp:Transcript_67290/g.101439  ORF Transcript_67290/g.101439 Transcript_67290/m.101439 type:complete len:82 (-) Transcript_67290:1533-1778(-)